MIKAHNISFYRLLATGYISGETFRAVMPKQRLYELSFSDCYLFSGICRKELIKLFEDEQVMSSIGYMEQLEKDINSNNNVPIIILQKCLSDYGGIVSYLINTLIGQKVFLLDYAYCTKEALSSLNYINDENISSFIDFIEKFRIAYQNHSQGLDKILDLSANDLELLDNIKTQVVPEPEKEEELIKSGGGFTSEDIISIDDDALSATNAECRKYILFLYSLNKEDLKIVTDHLRSLLSRASIRTLNGIRNIGYRNFLVNYLYADITKLLNIRNFGRKSLFELDKVKPELLEYISILYENDDTTIVDTAIEQENQIRLTESRTLKEKLGESQYYVITKEFERLTEGLSVRSRNGIIKYKGDFIEDFVNKNGDIKSIQYIGKKSEIELLGVVERLKSLISTMKEREISASEIDIMEKRSYYGECFDEYALNYYQSHGHLPMFYLLAKLLKKEISIKRNYQILNLYTPLFCDEDNYSLEEIADKLNLTRERVRQIHMKMFKLIRSAGENAKETKEITIEKIYHRESDWQYVIDCISGRGLIDQSLADEIGSDENHGLTKEFVFLVVSVVAKDVFTLIGRKPLRLPSKFKQRWNNSYLINKQFTDVFDFNGIFQLIEDYEDTYTEDIVASAKDLLIDLFYTAWKEFDTNVVEGLSEVISTILIQELGLIPDESFCFTIEGKKEVDAANILYDVLYANGNPLTIEELYNAIETKYPGKYKSPASIRLIVMRDPRMCSIGSNNLIGLLEWDHIKIGSIRDIITQYLSKFNEPQHISDIANYVRRYRDTSEHSIRSTMISGEQFAQFSGGLYGLKGKDYPSKYYMDESERNFEQKVKELELFLQEKKHFPFMPSTPSEESLYRWWQKNKNSTTLKDKQKSEIERIKTVYGMLPSGKRDIEWFESCQSYSQFVLTNGRRPSRHNINEKSLYAWFEKVSHDFSEGNLSTPQEKAFLELCKSL